MIPNIVIVNYNGEDWLPLACKSIRHTLKSGNYRLIIVDNGSADGSIEYLKKDLWDRFNVDKADLAKAEPERFLYRTVSCPAKEEYEPGKMKDITIEKTVDVIYHSFTAGKNNVHVVSLGKNYGFETGANVGMDVAEEYGGDVVLMGSDVELCAGAIEELKECAEMHPKIGVVAAKLLQRVQGDRYYVRAGGFTNEMGHEHITGWDHEPGSWHLFSEQEWVTFSLVYIKRKCIDEVGNLDMTFHIYCGDNDYSRRAKQAGWACVYCPTARAIHHEGRTVALVKRETPKAEWDKNQGEEMGYFHVKWHGQHVPFPILPTDFFDEINIGRLPEGWETRSES